MDKDLFECHITCMVSDADKASKVAEELHWKTSEIARDPVLGNDTFFYLTSHAATASNMMERMIAAVLKLNGTGIKVVREKIEHIIYDKRYG